MPIVSTTRMTANQFADLGEDPVGVRLELVNGEVAVSPSPIPDHSYIETMLKVLLGQHIRERKMGRLYGDVDTIFGPYDVRRPDVIYFSKARLHLVGKKAMEGPPDLCVEIVSPSSREIDRVDKFQQYAQGGVAFYWIVDPIARTIEAYQLTDRRYEPVGSGREDDQVALPPFEELTLPLGEVWPPND